LHNLEVLKLPPGIPFEGAGDALLDREHPSIESIHGFGQVMGAVQCLSRTLI
jgi:hypothetical protein